MDSKIAAQKPDDSEYEIIEGGSESALATGTSPWMNSATLKLRHRIGRGPFGDVWLATHHQSTEDYDEHHEVAIKMLHPIKEDQRKVVVDKFEDLFSKCQGVESVCLLRGVSSISGRVSKKKTCVSFLSVSVFCFKIGDLCFVDMYYHEVL